MKSSMKHAQSQALEAERRTSAAQLNAKGKELEITSTQLTIANDRCAELEGMLLRTATLVATLNQRIRMRRLLASHFKIWRTALAWGKHERQLYNKAEHWCATNTDQPQRKQLLRRVRTAADGFHRHYLSPGMTSKFFNEEF